MTHFCSGNHRFVFVSAVHADETSKQLSPTIMAIVKFKIPKGDGSIVVKLNPEFVKYFFMVGLLVLRHWERLTFRPCFARLISGHSFLCCSSLAQSVSLDPLIRKKKVTKWRLILKRGMV